MTYKSFQCPVHGTDCFVCSVALQLENDLLTKQRDMLLEKSKHVIAHWKMVATGNVPSPMTMLVERLRDVVDEIEGRKFK